MQLHKRSTADGGVLALRGKELTAFMPQACAKAPARVTDTLSAGEFIAFELVHDPGQKEPSLFVDPSAKHARDFSRYS